MSTWVVCLPKPALAITDKTLKRNVQSQFKNTKSFLISKKNKKDKIKKIESFKNYINKYSAKGSGSFFTYLEGLKYSTALLNKEDLNKGMCQKLENSLYFNFAPNAVSKKDLPKYAQDTMSLLKAYCKR